MTLQAENSGNGRSAASTHTTGIGFASTLNGMGNANAAVAIYGSTPEVLAVIRQLRDSEFDLNKVSMAGKDQRLSWQVTGYYRNQEALRYWGGLSTLYNEVWQTLSGWGFFALPGIGPVLVAGPLAEWIVVALNNAPFFGDMTAVGMGLYSVGVSKGNISQCEEALRAGKHLLLAHGSAHEVGRARDLMCGYEGAVLP
jgi:hypothetical protein